MVRHTWFETNKGQISQRLKDTSIRLPDSLVSRLTSLVEDRRGRSTPNPRNTLDMLEHLLAALEKVGVSDPHLLSLLVARLEAAPDGLFYSTIRSETNALTRS